MCFLTMLPVFFKLLDAWQIYAVHGKFIIVMHFTYALRIKGYVFFFTHMHSVDASH